MTAMRAFPLLAAALVLTAAFAGCIGGDKAEPGENVEKNNVPSAVGSAAGGAGKTPTLKVLSALNASIALDAPAWVQSGTEVPVSVSAPANAKGAVKFSWAIGPLPGTTDVKAVTMDTGSKVPEKDYIQPGASKSLTYSTAGVYRMHCHPHPNMRHNVTVIDGYEGPRSVEVFITDGAANEYRFVPENIVIGTNTTVVYKNVGAQPHTATAMGAQEPSLKALPLKAEKGAVKVEGEGWQRIVAVFVDSEGRVGLAEKPIYTTATLPSFETQTFEFSFLHGVSQLAGTPLAATADKKPLMLEQPGQVTINFTFTDAVGGVAADANGASVELHFTKDGETQDTLTASGASGSLDGKAIAGGYTLSVLPTSGVQISGTVTVEVVYELVPPPPTKPAAGGGHDDSGGGHKH